MNIQLFFTEDSNEPVVSEMARDLDVDFSICWAKLEDFRTNVYGSLIINIENKDKFKVLEYLDAKNVKWEVL